MPRTCVSEASCQALLFAPLTLGCSLAVCGCASIIPTEVFHALVCASNPAHRGGLYCRAALTQTPRRPVCPDHLARPAIRDLLCRGAARSRGLPPTPPRLAPCPGGVWQRPGRLL